MWIYAYVRHFQTHLYYWALYVCTDPQCEMNMWWTSGCVTDQVVIQSAVAFLAFLSIHTLNRKEHDERPAAVCTFHCFFIITQTGLLMLLTEGPESPISPFSPLSPGSPASPMSPLGPWWWTIKNQLHI